MRLMVKLGRIVKGVKSNPPINGKKIKNVWWNPDTQELVFDIED